MSSCSSCTSSGQQTVQQLLQKATNPTPQQASNTTLTNTRNASDKPPAQDPLNTTGDRGTTVNIKS